MPRGLPLPAKWTGYSQHSRDCLPLPTRYLPAREVLRFRDAAFREYYTHPRYLGMVQRKFGTETVEHLRQMTTVGLERDLLTGKLDVPPTLLPKEDPVPAGEVLVCCAVGKRGHVAARLLTQHGFDVRNLDGGVATWCAATC